jgi:hypothetical protein
MLRGATNTAHEGQVAASYSASGEKREREGHVRTPPPPPSTVYVTPNIINVNLDGDDSDPEEDRCFGHSITGYVQGRKRYLLYDGASKCRAWLSEHGYVQVTRTGMIEIDGKWCKQ